jgi:hypothetical protein
VEECIVKMTKFDLLRRYAELKANLSEKIKLLELGRLFDLTWVMNENCCFQRPT